MLRGNRFAPVSPVTNTRVNRDADTARKNLNKVQIAVAEIDKALNARPPFNLSPKGRLEWNDHTAWLQRTRSRFDKAAQKLATGLSVAGAVIPGASVISNALGGAFGSNLGGGGGQQNVADLAAANLEFLALQNAVQMESRKFQTLSNASKARHDIAMNAIRNTRA